MIRRTTVLLALLWPLASAAQSTETTDYAALATIIVQCAWHLAPGERVVIFWDRGSDRGMAEPLQAAIIPAGGFVEEIEAPTTASVRDLSDTHRAERHRRWTAAFARSQTAI